MSSWDAFASFCCQKPELASSLVKTLDWPISPRRASISGSGWFSRYTLSFNFVRSTHMRTFPLDLGTTTIPAHQGVGSSTLRMTPSFSMRSSSSRTFAFRGKATHLGVMIACGLASGFNLILYFPSNSPRP